MNVITIPSLLLRVQAQGRGVVCADLTMEAAGHLLSLILQGFEDLFASLQARGFSRLLAQGPVKSVEWSVRETPPPGLRLPLFRCLHKRKALSAPSSALPACLPCVPAKSLPCFNHFSNRTMGSPSSAASSGLDVHICIN